MTYQLAQAAWESTLFTGAGFASGVGVFIAIWKLVFKPEREADRLAQNAKMVSLKEAADVLLVIAEANKATATELRAIADDLKEAASELRRNGHPASR